VSPGSGGVTGRSIPASARVASADSSRRHFGRTFKDPRVLLTMTPGGYIKPGALVMSDIPVHLQRRFEQRWAARFVPPTASTAPKSIDLKRPVHNLPRIAKANEKPTRLSQRARS